MSETETTETAKRKRPTRLVKHTRRIQLSPTSWRTEPYLVEEPIPPFDGRDLDRETIIKISEGALPIPDDHPLLSRVGAVVRREAKVKCVLFGDGAGVSPEETEAILRAVDEILGPEAGIR